MFSAEKIAAARAAIAFRPVSKISDERRAEVIMAGQVRKLAIKAQWADDLGRYGILNAHAKRMEGELFLAGNPQVRSVADYAADAKAADADNYDLAQVAIALMA